MLTHDVLTKKRYRHEINRANRRRVKKMYYSMVAMEYSIMKK